MEFQQTRQRTKDMTFDGLSFYEFIGMIFFYPFVFHTLFLLFTGIEDAIIFWFRRKDYPNSRPNDL